MIRITIKRTSGAIEVIDRADLYQSAAHPSQFARAAKANRDAAKADPAKGGKLISIEWIEPEPVPAPPKDAETLAWERWEKARWALSRARDAKEWDDGTGMAWTRETKAAEAVKAERAAYLAEFGEDGAHLAAERRQIAAEKARKEEDYRTSFIGRGID